MAEPEKGEGEGAASAQATQHFDPTKLAEQFRDLIERYKFPNVDIDALVSNQRKNVEALVNANRVAIEGTKNLIERQGEILKETLAETSKSVEAISKSGSLQDAAAKQTELAKQGFDKAIANMRELAEMVTKANQDATTVINKRISEVLDEIKEMASKLRA